MAFHLSGKVVALHMDNSTAQAYLCNQGGAVFFFLSRLAYHILNLANKHVIALIPAYIPMHLNVEADYQLLGKLAPEWHLTSYRSSGISTLGCTGGGFVGTLVSMSALLYHGKSATCGSLGVEYFQVPLDISGELYVFSPSHISFPSSVQVAGR